MFNAPEYGLRLLFSVCECALCVARHTLPASKVSGRILLRAVRVHASNGTTTELTYILQRAAFDRPVLDRTRLTAKV
jgi:hypothetical protein